MLSKELEISAIYSERRITGGCLCQQLSLLFAARPSRGAGWLSSVVFAVMFESIRALEFYCGIGSSLSAICPFINRQFMKQADYTTRSQEAESGTTRPSLALLTGTKSLVRSTWRITAQASRAGCVFVRNSFRSVCRPSTFLLRSQVDIGTLDADAIEPLNANLWLLSPACQPYTVLNPRAKGAADPRAQSFLHLMENVLPALAGRGTAPARLLVENVAGFEVRGYYHNGTALPSSGMIHAGE